MHGSWWGMVADGACQLMGMVDGGAWNLVGHGSWTSKVSGGVQ